MDDKCSDLSADLFYSHLRENAKYEYGFITEDVGYRSSVAESFLSNFSQQLIPKKNDCVVFEGYGCFWSGLLSTEN